MSSNLSILDNTLILFYFFFVLLIGLFVTRNKASTSKEYFLAGKNLGWLAIGASLFATNISSEHLVGLAGAGSVYGFSVGHFEWLAAIILILLGWFFAPIFLKADVNTVPQFFGKRFDDRSRIYLTIVSVFAYLFTKIAVTLIAGGLVLREVLGWNVYTSAILIVLLTGLYTVIGGMNSVVYTQIFQSFAIVIGAVLLSLFGIYEIGGISGLIEKLPASYFHVSKPFSDPNLPWTGILLGAPIIGIWYWCSDQYMIQRIFSAKGISEARKGTVLASMLKIFPIFFFILPGLIAAVLYPNVKGDSAYSLLLGGSLLPIGIKGIVIIGFFAALMSSLSSSFNSAASLFALDVYSIFKKETTDDEIVLVGRLSTMFFVLVTIAIIPMLKFIDTHIYIDLQALQAYIAPPIVSVFLLGIFWKKASSQGAIWALIIGGAIGFLKIILSNTDSSWFSNIYFLYKLYEINYLHFAILLFILSSVIVVGVSILGANKEETEFDVDKEYQQVYNEKKEITFSNAYDLISSSKSKKNNTKSESIH